MHYIPRPFNPAARVTLETKLGRTGHLAALEQYVKQFPLFRPVPENGLAYARKLLLDWNIPAQYHPELAGLIQTIQTRNEDRLVAYIQETTPVGFSGLQAATTLWLLEHGFFAPPSAVQDVFWWELGRHVNRH